MADEKKIHPLQLAWLAGVFDARGIIPKSGYVLTLEMVDEPLMKRFRETLGFGRFSNRTKSDMTSFLWRFETTNLRDTWTLLTLVAPFLSPAKLKSSAEMVARIERSPTFLKSNPDLAEQIINRKTGE